MAKKVITRPRGARSLWAWGLLGLVMALPGCASKGAGGGSAEPAPSSKPALALPVEARDAAPAVADAGPKDAAPAAAPEPPPGGADFTPQAKEIFRVAACGGDEAVPAKIDAAMVDEHCKELLPMIQQYKTGWVDVAEPYIAKLRPKDLPTTVVYPFGGGDLMSALATYPDLTEITTISLEAAGDARRIDSLTPKQLKTELGKNRLYLGKLFDKAHSRTVNLDLESKSTLPGSIVFMAVALVIHGYEPVSLRYFKLAPDGAVKYVETADVAAADEASKKKDAKMPEIFRDVELRFRKKGDANGPVKILRHIAYNLDDTHLKANPSLLKYLEAKGKVSAMTKAASHCLWSDDFTMIRGYLLDHMAWMISDSTGVPPKYAQKAGFVQDTYGIMEWPEAFGFVDNKNAEDLKKLFKSNPQKDLPFRYGYPDYAHHAHMMVTRRPETPASHD